MLLSSAGAVLSPIAFYLTGIGFLAAAFGSFDAFVLGVALATMTSALAVVAEALLWLGLRRARKASDRPGDRRFRIALVIVAGIRVATLAAATSQNLQTGNEGVQGLAARDLILGVAGIVASTSVALVLVAGAFAGDRPRPAWTLAAGIQMGAAAGVVLQPLIGYGLALVFGDPFAFLLVRQVMALAVAAGMAGAFALGLPAVKVNARIDRTYGDGATAAGATNSVSAGTV
jgi:hypothetical protein